MHRDGGSARVAAAGLAVLAALLVAVLVQRSLAPVEQVFVIVGLALLALGTTLGIRLARHPRPRLMDGRFGADEEPSAPDAAGASPRPGGAAP